MPPNGPFYQALVKFRNTLDPKEEEAFRFSSLQDLQNALDSIQVDQTKRRTLANLSRIKPFLEAMEQYGTVVEVFLNVNDILAFVWVSIEMNFDK